jgi:hypothetical protein
MSLELVNEVWEAMSHHIDSNDRKDAAYDLVTLLIDLNHEPSEIREYLGADRDIVKALKDYGKEHEDDEEDEVDGFDFVDDSEWD